VNSGQPGAHRSTLKVQLGTAVVRDSVKHFAAIGSRWNATPGARRHAGSRAGAEPGNWQMNDFFGLKSEQVIVAGVYTMSGSDSAPSVPATSLRRIGLGREIGGGISLPLLLSATSHREAGPRGSTLRCGTGRRHDGRDFASQLFDMHRIHFSSRYVEARRESDGGGARALLKSFYSDHRSERLCRLAS
jgi:hypothetical protein